ncbi:hypothetical protein [Lunatimonas salinarum]|uniref:hypothetical protein n=1 Tax=Lunatimonas salinarum TaxID=1774590 RepID=UPI001AE071E7|nr:hypothetical protein [Lunatimonas salinarum]
MAKQTLIRRTIDLLEKLPESEIRQVADFADFVLRKYEEQLMQKGIEKLASNSIALAFLHDEEKLYDEADLKEKY